MFDVKKKLFQVFFFFFKHISLFPDSKTNVYLKKTPKTKLLRIEYAQK